jgi:hypothetical protein
MWLANFRLSLRDEFISISTRFGRRELKPSVPLKLRQERPICGNQNHFSSPSGATYSEENRRILKIYRWRNMPLLTELGISFCPYSTNMPRLWRWSLRFIHRDDHASTSKIRIGLQSGSSMELGLAIC